MVIRLSNKILENNLISFTDSASITTLIDSNYVSLRSASSGVFFENDAHVTLDYTIAAGNNAMSAGPITIDSGVTVTIPTGSYWTIV